MSDLLTFDYDRSAPLNLTTHSEELRDGITVADVSFAAIPGSVQQVHAYVVSPPEDLPPPHAAILWMHWLETKAETSNRTQFLDDAVTLAAEGVVSVLPDGFWTMTPERAAKLGKDIFVWKTDAVHDIELCKRQTIELRRALDLLLKQPGVDQQRVAFVGHDFGAMYGALMSAVEDRVQHYVLMAGTYSFSNWFMYGAPQDMSEEEKQEYIEAMRITDPSRYVKEAAPAHLYFQFARNDYYVPERAAQAFYEPASEPKEIAWYDAQHDLKDKDNKSGQERLDWLRKQLNLSGKAG